MIDEKTPTSGASEKRENPLIGHIKDASFFRNSTLLVAWIAGLVLIAGLSWFLTQPARSRFLQRAVNRALEQSGDSRRLGEPLSPGMVKTGFSGMGSWYTMTAGSGGESLSGETSVLVFTFIGEGTFFPCAAVVAPEGNVEEFIPLGVHGERMLRRVSPGILKIYARRIEGVKS